MSDQTQDSDASKITPGNSTPADASASQPANPPAGASVATANVKGKSSKSIEAINTQERIKQLQRHDKDVGSSEVQIGLLTDRILHLTAHLKIHPKDKHTNYGLRRMVADRKKLLTYLERTEPAKYTNVKSILNLR